MSATRDELYLLPAGADRYCLYGPLRRSLAVINGAAAQGVAQYLRGEEGSLSPAATEIVATLKEKGLLGDENPPLPVFPADYDYRPHEVTLFLTSRCNLRCRYCYADAGRKSVDMPLAIACAAVELVARNAGLLGLEKFGVGFHGGGEPTVAWPALVQVVEHAERLAEESGLEADLYAATNGVLRQEQREFVAEHFSTVNVSLDGPPEIQNHNRPRVNGSGSYDAVAATLKYFDQVGFFYGLRVTVTAPMVDRLAAIVRQLRQEFNFAYVQLEPMWLCGRCARTGEEVPARADFVDHFLAAVQAGRELGVGVSYSGARLDVLTSKFCAAPGDNFTVLPEGLVTSCYEITEADDPRARLFHYGRYDAATGGFAFDEEKLRRLRGLSVEHLEHCEHCFCKWHCAGDCLAKVYTGQPGEKHEGSVRCELNRALTLAQLEHLVTQASPNESRPVGSLCKEQPTP